MYDRVCDNSNLAVWVLRTSLPWWSKSDLLLYDLPDTARPPRLTPTDSMAIATLPSYIKLRLNKHNASVPNPVKKYTFREIFKERNSIQVKPHLPIGKANNEMMKFRS